jgi:hypothetical protein
VSESEKASQNIVIQYCPEPVECGAAMDHPSEFIAISTRKVHANLTE